MRFCGIDVSARPDNQQLCTLHERRGSDGGIELVATFYEPGTVTSVARTVLGFGGEAVAAVDAPSGHRLDLLAPGDERAHADAVERGERLARGRYRVQRETAAEEQRVADAVALEAPLR